MIEELIQQVDSTAGFGVVDWDKQVTATNYVYADGYVSASLITRAEKIWCNLLIALVAACILTAIIAVIWLCKVKKELPFFKTFAVFLTIGVLLSGLIFGGIYIKETNDDSLGDPIRERTFYKYRIKVVIDDTTDAKSTANLRQTFDVVTESDQIDVHGTSVNGDVSIFGSWLGLGLSTGRQSYDISVPQSENQLQIYILQTKKEYVEEVDYEGKSK